ncbi:hypothetical protein C0Q70_12112 [Pomacea canaliculata]|uniref:Uncharacterized protein n=1 Tax=Pomacea canaliculata TaxID=400727 RepID=A0A2T7P0M5_POMCA|nr:hypothetical protein C0Q70_12112 [Pomacea canaliculata]
MSSAVCVDCSVMTRSAADSPTMTLTLCDQSTIARMVVGSKTSVEANSLPEMDGTEDALVSGSAWLQHEQEAYLQTLRLKR